MSKSGVLGFLCAGAIMASGGYVSAAESSKSGLTLDPYVTLDAVPAALPEKDWTQAVKNPAPWLKWGADQRVRIEYLDNAITLNQQAAGHEWDFFRYRTRVWAGISPCEEFSVNARLIWEGRHWQNPVRSSEHTSASYKPEWDNAQGVFDIMNFTLNLHAINTKFIVGRQEIILGDGWLVLEGTPLDGSTSIYFDAVRSTTQFKGIQTTFDLIYINQYSSPDHWLPTINDTDRAPIENNERGAIAWLVNKSIKNLEIDAYFMYKHDRAIYPIARGADNADVYTFGTRLVESFTPQFVGRIEAAGQFGDKNGKSLGAWGLNSRLAYLFNDPMKNEIRLNFEFLSGNDDIDKNFDPLWGRWPQFSELYIYTYAKETRIANTTNLIRFGPNYLVRPTDKWEIELGYNALFAPENPDNPAAPGFTGTGNFRGHLFNAITRYKFSSHLSGHIWTEYLAAGDYYPDANRDNAVYLRGELTLSF